MKKILVTILLVAGVRSALPAAETNAAFADEKSRMSYALGMMLGSSWKTQGLDLDLDQVGAAIKASMAGGTTLLTKEEAQKTLTQFQADFRVRQQNKNKTDGEAFLAKNKSEPGVKIISATGRDGKTSDVQYLVLTNGNGAMPGLSDTVTVNYRGTFIDGAEFDSSAKQGHPATFQVGGVIPGWTAALQHMAVGSHWKLFIPSDLAYGEQGNRGIPPNSTLVFDVELLSIQTPPPPAPAAPLTSDIIKVPSADEMKKGAKIEVIKPEDAAKAQNSGK
jgi:FKBP-type peptidyl-prolyl cis-trans isomerase FklB